VKSCVCGAPVAVAIGVQKKALEIGDRQAVLASALARLAHAAIVRTDVVQLHREDLPVGFVERRGSGTHVALELIDTRHRNGRRVHLLVPENPSQS